VIWQLSHDLSGGGGGGERLRVYRLSLVSFSGEFQFGGGGKFQSGGWWMFGVRVETCEFSLI